jgi:prophage regulatory protein
LLADFAKSSFIFRIWPFLADRKMQIPANQQSPFPLRERILRRADVEAKVGIKRTALYEAIHEYGFPEPIQIGPRAVGWRETEVDAWIASRPRAPRENTTAQRALAAKKRYQEAQAAA